MAAPEVAPAPAAAPPIATPAYLPPTVPINPPVVQEASSSPAPQGGVAAPAVADDSDLIEKEWVHRAKQIVEATKTDPYRQTKALHAFRADYMKKRYNKTIEVVDE